MTMLRRFAAAGAVATLVDLVALAVLWGSLGWPAPAADGASITLAAMASFALHRRLTFADDPQVRWVHQPRAFVLIAAVAGALDVAVLTVVAGGLSPSGGRLAVAKVAALAVAGIVRVGSYRIVASEAIQREQRVPSRRPAPPGSCRLSVVVPAYQAAAVIGPTVAAIHRELADVAAAGGLEVLVVDDGSDDGTAAAARAAGADRVLEQPANRGKGAAVRAGVLASSGRSVVFTDADLSYAPDQIRGVLVALEDGWDVVVGSRHHVEAVTLVRARRLRELAGRVFNLFTAVVLLGRYRDTQCGLKGFRADVARLLFERSVIDGFAFDVELLHLVERYRLSLREIPAVLTSAETSTVRVGADALRMLRDLARIRRAGSRGVYDVGLDRRRPSEAPGRPE